MNRQLRDIIDEMDGRAGESGTPSIIRHELLGWIERLTKVGEALEQERAALEAAVLAEREACVLVCEQVSEVVGKSSHVAEEAGLICAHLICARSEPEEG